MQGMKYVKFKHTCACGTFQQPGKNTRGGVHPTTLINDRSNVLATNEYKLNHWNPHYRLSII